MPLFDLPNELLYLVAENLDSARDVFSLLLTSSLLARVLKPLLHKHALDGVGELSALQWAAKRGHESLARILLEKGVDIDFQTEFSFHGARQRCKRYGTALYRAVEAGNESMARLLLKHGARVNKADSIGRTPLHYAAKIGGEPMLRLLLDHGADTEAAQRFRARDRALSLAVRGSAEGAVRLLLERGADPSFRTRHCRETLLHLAAAEGNSAEVVDMLLNEGIPIDAVDDHGRTALSEAARRGNELMVNVLLQRGAEVDSPDDDGATALHRAALGGFIGDRFFMGIAQKLLECGADVTLKRVGGQTVFDDVRYEREMTKLLYRAAAFRKWRDGRIVFLG